MVGGWLLLIIMSNIHSVGCICVPDFAMLMLAGGITGVDNRQVSVTVNEDGEPEVKETRVRFVKEYFSLSST